MNVTRIGVSTYDQDSILAGKVNWQLEDLSYFRKCGEITASPDVQCFGLNCRFCSGICLQFEVFMQHLREQHSKDILAMYAATLSATCEQQTQTDEPSILDVGIDDEPGVKITAAAKAEVVDNVQVNDAYTLTQIAALNAFNEKQSTAINLNEICNNKKDASMKLLTSNLDSNNGIFTIKFEVLPETPINDINTDSITLMAAENLLNDDCKQEKQNLAAEEDEEKTQQDSRQSPFSQFQTPCLSLSAYPSSLSLNSGTSPLHSSFASTSSSPSCYSSATSSFCFVENSLPDILLSEDDAVALSDCDAYNGINWQQHAPTTHINKNVTKTPTNKQQHEQKQQHLTRLNISDIEEQHDILSYLLELYKQNEKLWNPKHALHKLNAQYSAYNDLSEALLRDKNISMTGKEVFNVLKSLHTKYAQELAKYQASTDYRPKLWYFEQMSFLNDVVITQEATAQIQHQIDTNTKCAFSRDILRYLLEAFKNESALWNPKHADYASNSKTKAYDSISRQLAEQRNLTISGRICYLEIQKLCTRYRKELRLMHKRKKTVYIPKLWCFEQLEFLRDIYEPQMSKRLENNCDDSLDTKSTKSAFLQSQTICFKSAEAQLQFIALYKNEPTLWNVDHPDFRSTTYRNKAFSSLLQQLNVAQAQNYTLEQLQKTIHELHKNLAAVKRKQLTGNATKQTTSEELKFLEAYVGPFRCANCNVLVKTIDQYKIHKSQHDGSQPFICTLCGKGFQMPGNLSVHIRRHKRDYPYACEVCEKSFATSTEVSIHRRTHTGERPYECELCSKSFKTWSFFDIHRRTHLKQSTFHCPICDKGFYEKNRYTDHMNGHLNIRKHQCNECKKSFTTFANLKKHLELHLPVKKYKCAICSKRFAQFASLRWHKTKKHTQQQQELIMET